MAVPTLTGMRSPARRAVVSALAALAVAVVPASPGAASPRTDLPGPRGTGAAAAGTPSVAPAAKRVAAERGLGLLPPTFRVDAAATLKARGKVRQALPASVDLSANAPAIGNQGPVGSCATWAIGYGILGYYARTQPHAGAPFAPLSLYNLVNGGRDAGSTASSIYSVLQSKGVVEQAVWSHGPTDYLSQPNATEAANALLHRTSGGSYLFASASGNQGTAAVTAIQTALAAGKPVAVGIPVHPAFTYLSSADSVMTNAKAGGSLLGYHMIAAYGYDSTGVKIANSWGTNWGRSGWATLGWDFVGRYVIEASTPGTFVRATAAGAPTVTSVEPRRVTSTGGATVTVRGTNLADATGVTAALVAAADSSRVHPLTSVAAGGTVLTGRTPANVPEGAYRLVVTNAYGSNQDTTADDVTVVAAPAFSLQPVVVPATGGTVALAGSGFGASAAAFAALGYTATVDGRPAPLTWASDSSVKVAVPPGVPGKKPVITLWRAGFSSAGNTSATYGSVVSTAAVSVDAAGPVLRLTGRGFANSAGWVLTSDADSSVVAPLPATTNPLAVGVTVQSDTAAVVRLPLAPGPAGVYRLSFTPDAATYPGAVFADSPAARYTYRLPTLTAPATLRASTGGGTTVVVRGAGLLAVDPASASAVTVAPLSDPTRTAAATVTARTDTALTVTLPPAALAAGPGSAPLEGAYRLVVTTPLGTAAVTNAADLVTYVKPFTIAVAGGGRAPATGGTVLVTGAGFGTSRADFTAARVTATAAGRAVAVTWVSDTAVAVPVPPGIPGASVQVVVARDTVPSAPVAVTYAAVITNMSASVGPTAGGTVATVAGRGFTGSSTWRVRAIDGTVLATLAPVTSLDGAGPGVVVRSDTLATVRMPAASGFGAVYLEVTPDQALYPGAGFAPTAKAVFVYSDLG